MASALVSATIETPSNPQNQEWYPFWGVDVLTNNHGAIVSVIRVNMPTFALVKPTLPPAGWTRDVNAENTVVSYRITGITATNGLEMAKLIYISDAVSGQGTVLQLAADEPFVCATPNELVTGAYFDGEIVTFAAYQPSGPTILIRRYRTGEQPDTVASFNLNKSPGINDAAVTGFSWGVAMSTYNLGTNDFVVVANNEGNLVQASNDCTMFITIDETATTIKVISYGESASPNRIRGETFTNNGVSVTASNNTTATDIQVANFRAMIPFPDDPSHFYVCSDTVIYEYVYTLATLELVRSFDVSATIGIGETCLAIAVSSFSPNIRVLVYATSGVYEFAHSGATTFVFTVKVANWSGPVPDRLIDLVQISAQTNPEAASRDARFLAIAETAGLYRYVDASIVGHLVSPPTVGTVSATQVPQLPNVAYNPPVDPLLSLRGANLSAGMRLPLDPGFVGLVTTTAGQQCASTLELPAIVVSSTLTGPSSVVTTEATFPAFQDLAYSGFMPPSSFLVSGETVAPGTESGWMVTSEGTNTYRVARSDLSSTGLPSNALTIESGGSYSIEATNASYVFEAGATIVNVCLSPNQDAVAWETSSPQHIYVATLPNFQNFIRLDGLSSLSGLMSSTRVVYGNPWRMRDIASSLDVPLFQEPIATISYVGLYAVSTTQVVGANYDSNLQFYTVTITASGVTSAVNTTGDLFWQENVSIAVQGQNSIFAYYDDFVNRLVTYTLSPFSWFIEGVTVLYPGTRRGFGVTYAPRFMLMNTDNNLFALESGVFTQVGGTIPVPAGKTPTGMLYVSDTKLIGIFGDEMRTLTLSGGVWTSSDPDTRFGANSISILGRCVWAGTKLSILLGDQTTTAARTVQYVDPNPVIPTPTPSSIPTPTPSATATATATPLPPPLKPVSPLLSNTVAAIVLALLCASVVVIIVLASVMRRPVAT